MLKTAFKSLKLLKNIKTLTNENSDNLIQEKAKRTIAQLFLSEKGILQKIGQNFDLDIDFDHDLSENDFLKLAIGKNEVEAILIDNFPQLYKEIELTDEIFLGSIAQVVKAKYKNRDIALKIKFPNIDQKIKEQLQLLNLGSFLGNFINKKFEMEMRTLIEDIGDKLSLELDFKREAQTIIEFKKLTESREVKTPLIIEELSNENIIAMEWIEGESIEQFDNLSKKQLSHAISTIFENYLLNFFQDGLIQGDNHPSNYLLGNEIFLIDFGHTIRPKPEFRKALYLLIRSVIRKENINYLEAYSHLGFDKDKLINIEPYLKMITLALFEPFTHYGAYSLKDWDINKKIDFILGDLKWWFRSSGSSETFQFLRSIYGILNVIELSDTKLCYMEHFFNATNSFTPWLESLTLSPPNVVSEDHKLSETIVIQVLENKKVKARVTLPINCLYNLESYISESTLKEIEKNKINLNMVIKEAFSNSLKPGQLFYFKDDNNKEYDISLK